jgi:hypothetical protein
MGLECLWVHHPSRAPLVTEGKVRAGLEIGLGLGIGLVLGLGLGLGLRLGLGLGLELDEQR